MPNRPSLDDLRLKMSPSVAAKNPHLFTNGKEKTGYRTADKTSDMEFTSRDQSVGKKKNPEIHPPCRIHVHSKRHKLADTGGISHKAAIDGIVRCGILSDDNAKIVTSLTDSQEKIPKTEQESTIITIEEV